MTSENYPSVLSGAEQPPSSSFEALFTRMPASSGPRRLLLTLAIFLVALGLRLVHLQELEGTPWADERGLISDSAYYDLRAREIADGRWLGEHPGFLSPLYCAFLGGVYGLSGSDPWTAKLLQVVMAALSVALVHRIGRHVFSEAASVLAALLLAAYGPLVYYSVLLLPTTLVFSLHALLLWVLVRGEPTLRRSLLAGVLVGLAIGAKANALLLLPAIGLWMLLDRRGPPLARRAGRVACLVLGATLAVAPITWSNWATSGELVLVTTTGGRNLLKGNGEQATGSHTSLNQETVHIGHYLEGTVDVERAIAENRELSASAWRGMRADPARALRLFGTKLLLFFNQMEIGIRDDYNFARSQTRLLGLPLPSFVVVVPLGLVGLVLWLRAGRGAGLLSLVLLTQVASFVLVFVLARYRMVAVLCLAPFAGQFVAGLISDLRTRRLVRAVAAVVLLVPAVWFVRLPVAGFEDPNPPGELHRFVADWHFEREEWKQAFTAYNRATKSSWHISSLADHWAVRARIADCYDELKRPGKAVRVRETLLAEIMQQYPNRPLELKDELREKLGLPPLPREE